MARADDLPNAPSLPVLDSAQSFTFIQPQKKINEGHDVPTSLTTKAYGDVMNFLLQLNRAMFPCHIKNASSEKSTVQTWELGTSENLVVSETIERIVGLLQRLDAIIDEIPPDPGPRRFGNASFRRWYEVVESRMGDTLSSHLPESVLSFPHTTEVTAKSETESYLLGSFGSAQRLDYGSGHELSFLAFLGCIWKLGGFQNSPPQSPSEQSQTSQPSLPPGNEERSIVLHILPTYLALIRRLIKTYTLEPAGSHGVWGLDDHSFLPYIFGSAQYGPPITPTSQTPTEGSRENAPNPGDVAKTSAVNRERDKNLYFGAIGFIYDVKKGPFWEHSPMLYDISGVRAGWGKINKGMIKMYNAEVLSKFPVVQHFPFGGLFSWEQDPNAPPPPASVHTSSQPIRDGPSVSLPNASARPTPQEGAKAPWASSHSMSGPLGGTKAPWAPQTPKTNDPAPGMSGTAAPWARSKAPEGKNARTPPSRFPQPASGLPNRARTEDGGTNATTMPPPTRAPWAKPP